MSEKTLRLILAGIMLVTLFLPRDRSGRSNWAATIYWVENPLCLPFLLSLAILMILNVLLAVCRSKALRAFYRIALLGLFPLELWVAFWSSMASSGFLRIGFWAKTAVVSAAVLIEIIFAVGERLKKP